MRVPGPLFSLSLSLSLSLVPPPFFFHRVRDATKTMGFSTWRIARGRGYGHGVIKNSLPLAGEVASGNLHLIPGGSLCQPASQPATQPAIRWLPARGKRGGELGRGNGRRGREGFASATLAPRGAGFGPFSYSIYSCASERKKKKEKKGKREEKKEKVLHPITRGI